MDLPDDDDFARDAGNAQDFDAAMLGLVEHAVHFVVAIYELDEDLIYLSAQWSLLTRGVAEPLYLSPQDFRAAIHPDDANDALRALGKCLRGDAEGANAELRVRSHAGQWRRFLLQGSGAERNEFGVPRRVLAAMFDITDHRRADTARGMDEEFYRAVFDHNLNGILLGTPDGAILRANPAACSISGYTESELKTLGRDGLVDETDGRLATFLEQRRYLGKTRGSVTVMRKDGKRVEVELTSVLFNDSRGRRCNVITLDPSGLGAAERSLARATRMLQMRKQCSKAIIASRDREALLANVCREAVASQNLALAWVGVVDTATLAVVPVAWHGDGADFLEGAYFSADARVEEGRGPVGQAIRERRALACNDVKDAPEFEPWRQLARRHGTGAVVALPLGEDDARAGVLVLHAREADFFDAPYVELLTELAQEMSFRLENLQRDDALHKTEARFRTLWETALDAIVILDADSVIHYANPAINSLFGYRIEEVIGRSFCMLYPPAQAQAHARSMQGYLSAQRPGRRWRAVNTIGRRKDGEEFAIEITFNDVTMDGERRIIGYVRDVTQRKNAEQLIRKQNSILRRIAAGAGLDPTLEAIARLVEGEVAGASCCFLVADESGAGFGQWIAAGRTVARARTLLAGSMADAASPAAAAAARREPVLLPSWNAATDWPQAAEDARGRGMQACFCWPVMGRSLRVLGVMMIERRSPGTLDQAQQRVQQLALELAGVAIESRRSEATIRQLAHCDRLTGLLNRAALSESLERAVERARRGEQHVGVLMVDLDRFKHINDTLGNEAGDAVLVEVGQRLQHAVRRADVVGRWGGDEFIVVVEQFAGVGALTRVAEKLVQAIAAPITLGQVQCQVTASIGVCAWPEDGNDVQDLLRHAGLVTHRVKQQGRNGFRFFSSQAGGGSAGRVALEAGLRRALEAQELVLHYQPRLDLVTGDITGVEALVRWQHPQQGLVWPAQFIALAEETGHMVDIGRFVLREACRQMRQWQAAGLATGRLAVNLSPRQLASASLLSDVAGALEETGLAPGMLELEITEPMLMQGARDGLKLLEQLHGMGVHLALDDFGTGPASLANLNRLPLESVKIDRSIIRDLPHEAGNAAGTRAMLAMAQALKLRVVAEGVETEAQLNFLHELQCDEIQGYYFSRPLGAAALEDFLRRYVSSGRLSTALRQPRPVARRQAARDQG